MESNKIKSGSFRQTNKILIDIIIDWIVSNSEMSFYGVFLSRFKFTEMSEIQTMAVRAISSGFELIYSPEFIEEKTTEEIRFVLIHEIYHCINRHHKRSVNHDPKFF